MKKILKPTSNKFALNLRDVISSFIAAFLTAFLTAVGQAVANQKLPSSWEEWKAILILGVIGGITVLYRQWSGGETVPTPNPKP